MSQLYKIPITTDNFERYRRTKRSKKPAPRTSRTPNLFVATTDPIQFRRELTQYNLHKLLNNVSGNPNFFLKNKTREEQTQTELAKVSTGDIPEIKSEIFLAKDEGVDYDDIEVTENEYWVLIYRANKDEYRQDYRSWFIPKSKAQQLELEGKGEYDIIDFDSVAESVGVFAYDGIDNIRLQRYILEENPLLETEIHETLLKFNEQTFYKPESLKNQVGFRQSPERVDYDEFLDSRPLSGFERELLEDLREEVNPLVKPAGRRPFPVDDDEISPLIDRRPPRRQTLFDEPPSGFLDDSGLEGIKRDVSFDDLD